MDESAPGHDRGRRGDTRARIQQVALELFAEQGYERTSLREIAERLGVTKAALYYHFRSKEDIVHSFTDDYFTQLDSLIAWGGDRPMTDATRIELLDRFIGLVLGSTEVFRFLERNQASLHGDGEHAKGGKHRFEQLRPRVDALVELIAGQKPPLRSRVRATTAIFAASISCVFFLREDADGPDSDELRAIISDIAEELTRDLAAGDQLPVI